MKKTENKRNKTTTTTNSFLSSIMYTIVNGWLCLDWAPCIQRGFQMVRLHLLSSTAEVSLCRMAVFFFSIPIFIGLPRGSRPAEEGGERG